MRWLRRLLFGPGSELGDSSLRGFAGASRASIGLIAPEEGPFDRPPEEAVQLDPAEVPWELRDDDAR